MISYAELKAKRPKLFLLGKKKDGKENKPVTLERLRVENPRLYEEVAKLGRAEGVKAERLRVSVLKRWLDSGTVNEKVASIVAEAIASGKTEEEVLPRLLVADRDPEFSRNETALAEKAGLSIEDLKKYGPRG
ncbi:MAG: hypothetical protein FVQ80_14050 [Planctomycetes bacterium]|nr:hypothetical protein [Planctomycetota bacterium]